MTGKRFRRLSERPVRKSQPYGSFGVSARAFSAGRPHQHHFAWMHVSPRRPDESNVRTRSHTRPVIFYRRYPLSIVCL